MAQPLAVSGFHFAPSQIRRKSVDGLLRTAHRTPGALVPDGWYARPLRFLPNTPGSSAIETASLPGQAFAGPGHSFAAPRVVLLVQVIAPVPSAQRP